MNLLVLALLAATTNTQPTNGTNDTPTQITPTQSKPTNKPLNRPSAADKKNNRSTATLPPNQIENGTEKEPIAQAPKKKKGEPSNEAPEAGSPAALVAGSFDAATQIANAAAKAAMDEVKLLQGIGGGATGASPVNAKLAEAGVTGAAAVAKEVNAPKKKLAEGGTTEEPAAKPEKKPKPAKPPEGNEPPKDGKVFGVKIEGAPQK